MTYPYAFVGTYTEPSRAQYFQNASDNELNFVSRAIRLYTSFYS